MLQVTAILSCTLDMGSDVLVSHLFNDCRLLDWLVGVQTEVTAVPIPGDQRQASTGSSLFMMSVMFILLEDLSNIELSVHSFQA